MNAVGKGIRGGYMQVVRWSIREAWEHGQWMGHVILDAATHALISQIVIKSYCINQA